MANAKPKDLAAATVKVHDLLKSMAADERQKVVSAVMTLFGESTVVTPSHATGGGTGGQIGPPVHGGKFSKSLATYLAEKQAMSNQTLRFLATADWLRQKGVTPLSTSAVAQALKSNNQSRLSNPSDCLNKNAGKGLVEKDGKTFFITPEGLASLGHRE